LAVLPANVPKFDQIVEAQSHQGAFFLNPKDATNGGVVISQYCFLAVGDVDSHDISGG